MSSFGNFKGQRLKSVGNTLTTLYTVPSGKVSSLLQLNVSTTGSTGVQASIAIFDGTNTYYIGKSLPVPVGASLEAIEEPIVLNALDVVKVICDTSGEVVDVVASILEDINS